MQDPAQSDLSVLLIEDDLDDQQLVRRAIASERPRIRLECAEQLGSGIDRLGSAHFDALLMDLSLPDSQPDDTIENLGRVVRSLPVIVLTGYGDQERGLAAIRSGAQDYIVKGIDPLRSVLGRSLRYAVARWRADAALRESEQRYRDLAESAPDVIFRYRMGDDGMSPRLEYVNRVFEETLGYTREELYSRPELSLKLVHPDDRELALRVARAEGPERYTIRWLAKDGQIRLFDCRAATVRGGAEAPPRVQGVGRDITAQHRAERALVETRQQLAQAQKMEAVGRLAGGIAHDFNNILTVIASYGYFVLQALPERSPLRDDIQEILRSGERAETLTSQLLAFSRRRTISPAVVDLNQTVSGMDRMLRRLLGEDIELCTVLSPELWNTLVDVHSFEQILLNLAVNARDAMPLGGKLTIETANVELDEAYTQARGSEISAGEYVRTSVTDNGIGMDAATREKIFEPFFTTKPAGKGTGLGLSTCYGLARQAGGYIGVYSELGSGTTFSVYLPRAREAVRPGHARRPARRARGSERILLVEDDAALRAPAERALKSLGYDVLVAADAQQALELAAQASPPIELLLTDVVMPGMSGKQLAEQLSSSVPDLKVLYMSGYTENAIVHHGVLEEGVLLLNKPFTPERLGTMVREALDRARAVFVDGDGQAEPDAPGSP